MRRTLFVDGKIAAMFGWCGTMLSDVGHPYLFTSAAVERAPVGFVKTYKRVVAEMLSVKACLVGHVAADYGSSCKLMQMVGFELSEPQKIGTGMFREAKIWARH